MKEAAEAGDFSPLPTRKLELISRIGNPCLRFNQVPEEARNFVFSEIVPSALAGEKRSFGEDSRELLKDLDIRVMGAEKIPSDGPFLVISNHWLPGPMLGIWVPAAISREVYGAREGRKKDVRWIVNANIGPPVSGLKLPFLNGLSLKIADSYSFYQVRMNGRASVRIGMNNDFKNGEVIGLFPEANTSKRLKRGDMRAGLVAIVLARARRNAKVLPVGAYSLGEKLHLNFGRPFPIREILERSSPLPRTRNELNEVVQRVADYMMRNINPLVPPQYRSPEVY